MELTFQAGMDLPCALRWRKGAKGLFAAQCGFGCSFARSLARSRGLWRRMVLQSAVIYGLSRVQKSIRKVQRARMRQGGTRESASFYAAKVRPSPAAFVVDPRLLALYVSGILGGMQVAINMLTEKAAAV